MARRKNDDCKAAGVAYYHKQNGEWLHESQALEVFVGGSKVFYWPDKTKSFRVGHRAAGHLLDGVEHRELPT